MGFPLSLIKGIVNVGKSLIGFGASGSGAKASTSSTPDYGGQIAVMQAQAKLDQQAFERKQAVLSQAESSKQKNLLMMLGGLVAVLMLFMYMRKKK